MAIVTIQVDQCVCERCGHRWTPRQEKGLPVQCPNPKCQSGRWNQPKIEKAPSLS